MWNWENDVPPKMLNWTNAKTRVNSVLESDSKSAKMLIYSSITGPITLQASPSALVLTLAICK